MALALAHSLSSAHTLHWGRRSPLLSALPPPLPFPCTSQCFGLRVSNPDSCWEKGPSMQSWPQGLRFVSGHRGILVQELSEQRPTTGAFQQGSITPNTGDSEQRPSAGDSAGRSPERTPGCPLLEQPSPSLHPLPSPSPPPAPTPWLMSALTSALAPPPPRARGAAKGPLPPVLTSAVTTVRPRGCLGPALKDKLHDIIKGHKSYSHLKVRESGRSALRKMKYLEIRTRGPGHCGREECHRLTNL